MREKTVFALTGPMCAGKNYIGALLENEGCRIIDADICAHKALELAAPRVIESFSAEAKKGGVNLLAPDGALNRRALASIVFSKKALLSRLESIEYPIINDMIENIIDSSRARFIAVNAALLYKIPVMERCAFVIYADAPFFTRLRRARLRDGLPYRRIMQRFWAQRGLFSQYARKNTDIYRVKNTGDSFSLRLRLAEILSRYKK